MLPPSGVKMGVKARHHSENYLKTRIKSFSRINNLLKQISASINN